MPDDPADEYVDDGSVEWQDLGAGIVGAGVSVGAYAVASYITLLRRGVTSVLEGIGGGLSLWISSPFYSGTEAINGLFAVSANAVSAYGIFAPMVAGAVSVATVLTIAWGVSFYVR